MSIEVEEMLKCVAKEDLDCVVQERERNKLAVGRVADAEDVICELQDTGVLELQAGCCSLVAWSACMSPSASGGRTFVPGISS